MKSEARGMSMSKTQIFLPSKSPLCLEKINLHNILKCCFGLSDIEASIFMYLFENGEKDIKELSRKFSRDPSVIYRMLQKLIEYRLVTKKLVKSKKGRSYYIYNSISREKLKKRLEEIIERWYRTVKSFISTL